MENPLYILKIICHNENFYTYEIIHSQSSYSQPIDKVFRKKVDPEKVKLICKEIEQNASQFNQSPTQKGNEHYESFIPLGKALYHTLIPNDLETELYSITDPILISTDNPDIYWELLYDDNEFWGMKYKMSRQLLLSSEMYYQYYKKSTIIPYESYRTKALVIASNPLKDIPQVTVEVKKLLNWLKQKEVEYTYISPEEATYIRVITELEKGNYNIFHYAGHIIENRLLLNDKPISTNEIENHAKPCKLVYLSCCESARGVESFANAFLKKGARLVIGTLFKVNDKGARIFAEKFYESTFQGKLIGENVRSAKLEVKEKPDYGATWASIIMYGDPRLQYREEEKIEYYLEEYLKQNWEHIREKIEHDGAQKKVDKEFILLDILQESLPDFNFTEEIHKKIYEVYINIGIEKDREVFQIPTELNWTFAEELSSKFLLDRIEKISPQEVEEFVQERKILYYEDLSIDKISDLSFFRRDIEGNLIFFDEQIKRLVTAERIRKDIIEDKIETLACLKVVIPSEILEIVKGMLLENKILFDEVLRIRLYR